MSATVKLGSRQLNKKSDPYIIAEIGVNHEGSLGQAKKLIELAAEGGADAAKFQSYKASALASKNSPSYWDTTKETSTSQFELFSKLDKFGEKEFVELHKHCMDLGIDFLSTPFDEAAIEYLSDLTTYFKIASADLNNIPFLRSVGRHKKPVVLSTGASTVEEIDVAISTLNGVGCDDVVLLHCILNYPTEYHNAHLGMIDSLIDRYPNKLIGYSDHTLPGTNMMPLMVAFLKGAVILEKHFTHDKSLPGNDHYHAMDVNDLKTFKANLTLVSDLIGASTSKFPLESEEISRQNARRSIVAKENLTVGQTLTAENLTYKRPGAGISVSHWDEVVGTTLKKAVEADQVLHWEDIKT